MGGWVVMVQYASPETSFLITMCVGIAMSWIVGIRHRGQFRYRFTASTTFIFATLVVALFSAVLTAYLRPFHQERTGWILATTSPFAAFALIFLIRSWALSGE